MATTHLARRMASWKRDRLAERIAIDRAALRAAERAANPPLELNALLYGITDLTEFGNIDEGRNWFGRFRKLAGELRQPVYDGFVLFLQATDCLLRGRYEEAGRLSDEGLAVARQSHGVNAEQAWAGQAFIRAWDGGRLPSLLEVVGTAEEPAPGVPIWRIAHGLCLVADGQPDAARPVLEALVGEGVDLADNSLWSTGVALLCELARAVDNRERAATLLEVQDPYLGRLVLSGMGRACLGPVSRYAGIAALVAGRTDTAERLLVDAEETCRRIRANPFLARTLLDQAALYDRRGEPGDADRAARVREEAAGIAERIGLVVNEWAAV